jgi:hypothetical protein
LQLSPSKVGVTPSSKNPNVWGILMEVGFPNGVVTLLCLAEGTTSLYFGSGGGILGTGNLEAIAQVSQAFLTEAEGFLPQMAATNAYPLPLVGRVRFYALTFAGVFTSEKDEAELGQGVHGFSALFSRGQDVITQIRLQQQQPKH